MSEARYDDDDAMSNHNAAKIIRQHLATIESLQAERDKLLARIFELDALVNELLDEESRGDD